MEEITTPVEAPRQGGYLLTKDQQARFNNIMGNTPTVAHPHHGGVYPKTVEGVLDSLEYMLDYLKREMNENMDRADELSAIKAELTAVGRLFRRMGLKDN